jgi:hypothetical protein
MHFDVFAKNVGAGVIENTVYVFQCFLGAGSTVRTPELLRDYNLYINTRKNIFGSKIFI